MNIFIATPFYDRKAWSPYVGSLIETTKQLTVHNTSWQYGYIEGDAYISRARNILTQQFMQSPCDTMMFIDSDIEWTWDDFRKLVTSDYLLVSGKYKTKERLSRWTFTANPDIPVLDNRYTPCYTVPAGFLCVRKRVFERIGKKNWWTHLTDENGIVGEDVSFCSRVSSVNITPFVDNEVNLKHWGDHAFQAESKFQAI